MSWRPQSRDKVELTEGSIFRSLGHLAAPMLASAILQNIQNLIDLFWVGRLGSQAVAGVAVSGTILMLLFPMVMGLSTGTLAIVARAVGAGRTDEACAAAGQSLSLAVIVGMVSGALGWFFADDLFRLLGAAPDVIAGGHGYLRISLLGSFTAFVLFIGNAALQGAGDAVTPMALMAIANVLNILLNPLFIFGFGPVPRMGVQGSALATVTAQAVAALAAIHVLFNGKSRLRIRLDQWKPDAAMAWRILKIGIPGSGQMLTRSLMGAVMMRIVAGCGTTAVAAYGVGLRLHMIILLPAFALGGAAATMVGQNLGAGKPERAARAAWAAAWFDMAIMFAAAVVIMLGAPLLIRCFNNEADVIQIGARYLRIVSPSYLITALGIVLGRALNGAGDSLSPMVITMISLWGVQVPLAMLLAYLWQPATAGIWWAIAAANALHGLMIAGWFETGRWRRRQV